MNLSTPNFFIFFAAVFLWSLSARAAPLGSSILLFGESDFENCPQQVRKAAELGNTALSFVPTFYFERENADSNELLHFCSGVTNGGCAELREEHIHLRTRQLTECFRVTHELGIGLVIMPHLDDAVDSYWRNDLIFDPLKTYEGFSYAQAVIQPVSDALMQVLGANAEFSWALFGEMGASAFGFAQSYRVLRDQLKLRFVSASAKIGTSFNHDTIAGQNPQFNRVQQINMQALLNESDFVGISAYTPQRAEIVASDFGKNITKFKNELWHKHEITLAADKEIQFSEIALGGGNKSQDGRAARNAQEAASAPYAGVSGAYNPRTDPWAQADLNALRTRYYAALLEFLSDKNSPQKVSAAFIWNTGSWDVQGLYPGYAPYADPQIVEKIRVHNQAAGLAINF